MTDERTSDPQEQGDNREVGHKRPPAAFRFRPGQSGNPGGRRKGRSLTRRIAEILARETIGDKGLPDGKCVADLLAEVIVKQACLGKFPFVKEVLDRMEGKVPDRIAGHDGGPLGLADGIADLSGLDDDDLLDLARIAAKLC